MKYPSKQLSQYPHIQIIQVLARKDPLSRAGDIYDVIVLARGKMNPTPILYRNLKAAKE